MKTKSLLRCIAGAIILLIFTTQVAGAADPCQSAIVKSLAKYKKVVLKSHSKCLDKENVGLVAEGSCPDAVATLAIGKANLAVKAKIAGACTLPQITGLGYLPNCLYKSPTQGREAQCAALPVSTTDEFAECMKCWKGAELTEFLATVYASRALEECGGDLSETSPICSDLDCNTPLPVQRLLGDTGENDCQRGIAKGGIKYLIKREKIIEKCLLKGCTPAQCLGGTCPTALTTAVQLQTAEAKKVAYIDNKCGNRDPDPALPGFCCRCGQGQAMTCMLAADRATCEATVGCDVQEGKECDTVEGKCVPGPRTITWWNNCPESTTGLCPGDPVTTLDQLTACVDKSADVTSDELLCLQFPGYPCPLETTTTTTSTTVTTTTTTTTTTL